MEKLKSWITYPTIGNPFTLWQRMNEAERYLNAVPGYKEAVRHYRQLAVRAMIVATLFSALFSFGLLALLKFLGFGVS